MRKQEIDLIHRGYEAIEQGDVGALLDLLHPDVEWRNPEYAVEPGIRQGREGFGLALRRALDIFEYSELRVDELVEFGDRIVVILRVRGTGKESGAPIDQHFGHVLTMRDGKIASLEWFMTPQEALAAAESAGDVGSTARASDRAPAADAESVADDANGLPLEDGNIELARRIYEVFDTDPVALLGMVDSEIEYANPDDAVEPGTRRGHDGMAQAFTSLRRAFDEFRHEPTEFVSSGDQVVVRVTFRARGRGSGVALEHEEAHVWTFRDGLATRFEWFRELDQALEAAGAKR